MSLTPEEVAAELAGVDLFKHLSADGLKALAEAASVVELGPGEEVFREGDTGDAVFIVREGMVKVVRAQEPDVTLRTLKPGDAMGELAVLNAAPRTASAISIDETRLLRVGSQAVDRVLDDPVEVREMLGHLATSLTKAREEVVKENVVLDEKVRERTEELRRTQLEVIQRLARAAEFRDDDTGIHITRMSYLSAALAEEAGVGKEEVELFLHAVPMHDVGKIGISDGILLKQGKLEPEEFEVMKTHTTIGAELLSGATSEVMELARVIALNHHERWNGAGYPNGIAGSEIPYFARIAAVADVFDALISERPYKMPWSRDKAFDLIATESGKHFDPHLADLFVGMAPKIESILDGLAESKD